MFNLMIQQSEQNHADKLMAELSTLIQKSATIDAITQAQRNCDMMLVNYLKLQRRKF
jgi:mannitol/fructose-specific phosphotransferase system IIA component (Ntr-type)